MNHPAPTPCPVYGQDGSRCALPAGHAPAGDGRNHVLVVTR